MAFLIALLSPYIDGQQPLFCQLSLLPSIILSIEFFCLILYAEGGKILNHLLQKKGKVQLLNRIAGNLMVGAGTWLAFY